MKNLHRPFLASLLGAASLLLILPASRADFSYQVTLDLSSLAGNSAAPFSLDLALTPGSNVNLNAVTLSNFSFTGGTPTGSSTLLGGASGSLATSITLSETSSDNEFYQAFSAGVTKITFNVSETTNVNAITPDHFGAAILDNNLGNIPTTASDSSDTLVASTISTGVSISTVQTSISTGSTGGVTASVAAVPEPSALCSIALAFGLFAANRSFGRRRCAR